jgi:Icc protein
VPDASRESLLVHVSDVHATGGAPLYGVVDGIDRLTMVGQSITSMGVKPDAVLITGDLVQNGSPQGYDDLEFALVRLEDACQAPVLLVPGNHDRLRDFVQLTQSRGVTRRVALLPHTRVALLDSSSGSLGEEQLEWLAGVLASPYRSGTVIALHHPPVSSPLPALAGMGLQDAAGLEAVIASSDVRLIVAGHYHHALSARLGETPVWVGPALAYQQDATAGASVVRGLDLPSYSLVHLHRQGHTAVPIPLQAPPPLFTSAPSITAVTTN